MSRTASNDVVPFTTQQLTSSVLATPKVNPLTSQSHGQAPNSQNIVINGSVSGFPIPHTAMPNVVPTPTVNGYMPGTSYMTTGLIFFC